MLNAAVNKSIITDKRNVPRGITLFLQPAVRVLSLILIRQFPLLLCIGFLRQIKVIGLPDLSTAEYYRTNHILDNDELIFSRNRILNENTTAEVVLDYSDTYLLYNVSTDGIHILSCSDPSVQMSLYDENNTVLALGNSINANLESSGSYRLELYCSSSCYSCYITSEAPNKPIGRLDSVLITDADLGDPILKDFLNVYHPMAAFLNMTHVTYEDITLIQDHYRPPLGFIFYAVGSDLQGIVRSEDVKSLCGNVGYLVDMYRLGWDIAGLYLSDIEDDAFDKLYFELGYLPIFAPNLYQTNQYFRCGLYHKLGIPVKVASSRQEIEEAAITLSSLEFDACLLIGIEDDILTLLGTYTNISNAYIFMLSLIHI